MMRREQGFSFAELLVAMTMATLLFLAVFAAYSQASSLKSHVEGHIRIQDNIRLAMFRLQHDLRMIGFGVPQGQLVGGSTEWTPAVFHARPTEIGFRAEIDAGNSQIVCTPRSTNTDCPLSKLRLESIDYFSNLNCDSPDGSGSALKLIAVHDRMAWQPFACSGTDSSDDSIAVTGITDETFFAGFSQALTVEQVYLRYVPGSQPPYGSLTRYVRYDNAPVDTFPPSGITWSVVANHLTDFWLEYQDETGTVLTGNPLSKANREAIHKIVVFMEGYDRVGPHGQAQLLQTRSEILLRN